jgi:hypothetical protein
MNMNLKLTTVVGLTLFAQNALSQLEKIDLPNKDIPYLKEKLLIMYANPLINSLVANQCD